MIQWNKGITITAQQFDKSTTWHFNPAEHCGMDPKPYTNLRHGLVQSDRPKYGFVITNPQEGCVVVVGTSAHWIAGRFGEANNVYSAHIFRNGEWAPLGINKWVSIENKGLVKGLGYGLLQLQISIQGLRINLAAEIALDFWAGFLSVADVLALHNELVIRGKLAKVREAIQLVETLKGALGVRSKTAAGIKALLQEVIEE